MEKSLRVAGYYARKSQSALDRMIRVDHAGELGADRIYYGQNFVSHQDEKNGPIIQHMWNQEKAHLEELEYMSLKYRTRKSLLEPLWSIGGFILGAGSAMIGSKAAMACTVAVENVITQHYNDQIREIIAEEDMSKSQYILEKLSQFRDDEQHHHDTAKECESTDEHAKLKTAIDIICRASINIAERI